MAATRLSDVVVPELFTSYVQQQTTEKSAIVQSGALVQDGSMSALLAGGGLTFNQSSFKDLDNDADLISDDDPANFSAPLNIGTATEIQVRLNRNNSWSSMNLVNALTAEDPMAAIGDRVASYWTRRLQAAFVATVTGIFADNAAAPAGTEHVQNDMTHDIKGASYTAGVTDISAGAIIDASATLGDSSELLALMLVHPTVYSTLRKNNLIDFIPDSSNNLAARIPTYQNYRVVQDAGMPSPSSGIFETWFFGAGSVLLGNNAPAVPTEIARVENAGNGSGQDILYNRVQWLIHPVGNAYVGTAANGGPSNAATTHNLAAAASWQRVYSERNQIEIARLVTREF